MSQVVKRKSGGGEEKEKRHTDSPVKDMKKKMAANAEKEKQAAEKTNEKPQEKGDTSKQTDKKAAEKKNEKFLVVVAEKSDGKDKKEAEKKEEKDKKDGQEKKDDSKGEKSGKSDKEAKPKDNKDTKTKQNGPTSTTRAHNGVSDVTLSATRAPSANGDAASEEEGVLVIDSEPETERDELFPELAYDDDSDADGALAADRSATRRSHVKPTRTPETPRPASDKQIEKESAHDDAKDKEKVLKMKEDVAPSTTERKLRSSDAKPEEKKQEAAKKKEAEKKGETEKKEGEKKEAEKKGDLEVVMEGENDEESRKPDTNYSKSRVKVSPYRRSARLADQTTSSVMANYTGNNTTMEMDITETSSFVEDASLDDSSYLSGLRSIRGRKSYKPLKEITIRHVANRSLKTAAESGIRPTAPVVGRKRKPDVEDPVEVAVEASESSEASETSAHVGRGALAKRMRLLDRIAMPFRRNTAARSPEIVGINTDLPLSAPVSSPDPETLKTPLSASSPLPLAPPETDRDGKRCIVM